MVGESYILRNRLRFLSVANRLSFGIALALNRRALLLRQVIDFFSPAFSVVDRDMDVYFSNFGLICEKKAIFEEREVLY